MASLNPNEGFPDDLTNLVATSLPLHIDTSIIMDHTTLPDMATPPTPTTQGKNAAMTPQSALCTQKRRSSTRSIKRKKFDDELVESSLTKTERTRPRLSSTSSLTMSLSGVPLTPTTPQTPVPGLITTSTVEIPPVPQPPMEQSITTVASTSAPVPNISHTPISTPVTTTLPGLQSTLTMTTSTTSTPPLDVSTSAVVQAPAPIPAPPPPPPAPEKKKSKSSSKRSKKAKPLPAGSTKDLGRWKPQDDLALINAVQQTCDLTAVFHGVKFSCRFTLKEIQERWYALMYDSVLSKLAIQAIKQLHPDVVVEVNTKALYSKEEEGLLKQITSTSQPTLDTFEELLASHPTVFHPGRTGKVLHSHWLLMKQYHLLPDQSVPPMPKGDHVLNFSDAEDMINEDDLKDPSDEILEHELMVADRRHKREIRHVEQELPKWQVLVDSVTGISPPDFDNQTLAVLRGRLVRYLMRSREISLGRATKDNQIDVDLSLEGPAWKISRRQGTIKLRNCGDFYIANEGKRPLYIDGKPVLTGGKQKLNNNSVVEISCLRFIFLINQDLIAVIRQEAQKAAT